MNFQAIPNSRKTVVYIVASFSMFLATFAAWKLGWLLPMLCCFLICNVTNVFFLSSLPNYVYWIVAFSSISVLINKPTLFILWQFRVLLQDRYCYVLRVVAQGTRILASAMVAHDARNFCSPWSFMFFAN